MSLQYLSVFVLLLIFTAGVSVKRGEILSLIGEVLRVHQWYFLEEGTYYDSIESIARYLARNGQFAMVSDKFDPGFCKTHSTVIVTNLSFLRILPLIKDNAPECTWIVIGPRNPEWLEELPPLRSLVIFYEANTGGALLNLAQKPCWNCPLLTKSLQVDNSSRNDLESFFSNKLDFLNDSTVQVSVNMLHKCDLSPLHDPFMLMQCYHLEIINMVSQKIRFRPKLVLPIYPEHPFNFPNGSHGGIFLQLLDRSIDMSAASTVVAKERMHLAESVWPTFEMRTKLFVKAGQKEIVWLGYFHPFAPDIWFTIFGVITAGSLALILVTSHVRYKNCQSQIFILFPIFYVLQVLCLQSLVKIPNLISSRIAYISLLITAATVLPAYSGSLVSFLTTSKQYYPFTTLDEFIADGRYLILTRNPHFIHSHLSLSEMNNLTNLMVPDDERVTEAQDGFHKLCDGWLAYVAEDIIYTPVLKNYPCRITETPVTYLIEYLSISLPKNFPLTEQMRIGNILARSSGIKDALEKSIIYETRPTKIDKHFLPVILNQVAPMFVFLLVFIVLAWIILGFELLHQKYVREKQFKGFVRLDPGNLSVCDKKNIFPVTCHCISFIEKLFAE